MIKIQRLSAPKELTPEVVAAKTQKFKTTGASVWDEAYIKDRLEEMSHSKCCYCECKLGEESKYMEVEHFHDKHDYPDEVVEWENLLPSCRTCNATKGTHDTINIPIVNPSVDDPREHLGFRHFRYKEKDDIGKETREALHLNDQEKHCVPRYKVCNELELKVEEFLDDIEMITVASRTQVKNRMRNKVKELLEACQSDREYTAVKATTMVNSADYAELVNRMKERGLWTTQLEELDANMRDYAMDLL